MFLGFLSHSLKGMQREAPDYSAEVQDSFTLQNAAHILKVRKRLFLKDGERSYSEGRESRKDTISQLSTPAWFSGVSGKGFHT